jgi:hypothetical protein
MRETLFQMVMMIIGFTAWVYAANCFNAQFPQIFGGFNADTVVTAIDINPFTNDVSFSLINILTF